MKKNTTPAILTAFCCFLYLCGHAQVQGQALIDSLLKALPAAAKDTHRVLLLNQIGRNYAGIDPNEAFKYCNEALQLANQLQWTKGRALAYYNRGVAYSNTGNFPAAEADYTTSQSLYRSIKDQKGIADNYNGVAILYIYQAKYTVALNYLDSCIRIRQAIGDKKGEADCFNNKGAVYQYTGDLPQSLQAYNAALDIFTLKQDKERIAAAYNNIGTIYKLQGHYPKALEYLLKALKTDTELKKTANIVTDHGNIANVYAGQNNLTEALKHYNIAIGLARTIDDKNSIATLANNIGEIYYQLDKFPEALQYDSLGLQLGSEIGNNAVVANAHHLIGKVQADLRHFTEAQLDYEKALEMFRTMGDSLLVASVYANMGIVYAAQQQWDKAEQHFNLALQISKQLGEISIQQSAHEGLTNLYTTRGESHKALSHYKQFILLKDSTENIANTRKITQLQDQFYFDLQSDSIKLDTQQRFAIAEERSREKIRTGIIIGVALILLLLVIFYFYRKRERDRFELQKAQLRQDALKAQLDTHFVSATLEVINSLIEYGDKASASSYLLRFSRLIRNVLSHSFANTVTLKAEIDFLDDYFQLARLQFPDNHIRYELDIDDAIDTESTLVPPMIFQVLVENALRHAFKQDRGGTLRVKVTMQGQQLHCSVEDDGIGRQATRTSSNGQRPSYGTTLAAKLMKIWQPDSQSAFAIEDLSDATGKPAGTRATFTFPHTTY